MIGSQPPLLKSLQKFSFTPIPMKRRTKDTPNSDSWTCSATDVDQFSIANGVCETGMVAGSTTYSEYVQGYYCNATQLNLCLKCCLKYKDCGEVSLVPLNIQKEMEANPKKSMQDFDIKELGLSEALTKYLEKLPLFVEEELKDG